MPGTVYVHAYGTQVILATSISTTATRYLENTYRTRIWYLTRYQVPYFGYMV